MIRGVKGMNDVRPGAAEAFLDSAVWQLLLERSAAVLEAYGYRPVYLPVVEETALFARGIGEDTDIVSKEMYSFTDRGERQLTLRPEGTAGAVRAYVEHSLGKSEPVQKWWYLGPMFRAENVQKGRYRQFYQVGAELFGVAAPLADAEMIVMVTRLCHALDLSGIRVRVNSLGDAESRANFRDVLKTYLSGHVQALCESCKGRLEKNPLRVLDCKREGCRQVAAGAPDILGSLSEASRQHFDEVQALLRAAGVGFERDPRLVRGLDYYTGTIFELTTSALGAQDAVLGGGRYDDLVAELGGPPTPAIGFAAGLERLALLVSKDRERGQAALWRGPHLYVIPMPGTERVALKLADQVRAQGAWRVEVELSGARVQKAMKRADKSGALASVVLGENELQTKKVQVKGLREGGALHEGGSRDMVELGATLDALRSVVDMALADVLLAEESVTR